MATELEKAQIQLVEEIYTRFKVELGKLQRRQNDTIQKIVQRVDHSKTEQLLEELHKS